MSGVKKILSLLAAHFITVQTIVAQCCTFSCYPCTGPATIFPQTITSDDNIKIVTFASIGSWGSEISTTYTVDILNKKILLEGCYIEGQLNQPRPFTDTFSIGKLQPGVYTVTFTARLSVSTQTCTNEKNNSMTFSFTVNLPTSQMKYVLSDFFNIYPNPVKDKLFLDYEPGKVVIENVVIANAIGQQLFNCSDSKSGREIDFSFLPKGIYFLGMKTNVGLKTVKILKE